MASHRSTGGAGLEVFKAWSTRDRKFAGHGDLIEQRWNSLNPNISNGRGIGTLRKILSDHCRDWPFAPDASDDFDEIEPTTTTAIGEASCLKVNKFQVAVDSFKNALFAVVKSRLDPAWDELQQNVVLRASVLPWPESYGRVLTENLVRLIRVYFGKRFQGAAYGPSKENVHEALVSIAFGNKFNPVLEYLDGLQWDRIERIENLFGHYFNCDDDPYTRAVSECFMIGSVRRMRNPGCKFDTMPILKGPQGWMKSTAIKVLFGQDWFSDAELGDLHSKDAAMKLRGIWVQEFAELEGLTRSETAALKAFISRAVDRNRDPYGRVVENVPRRSVFIGTTNESGYLKDSTGSRRFWPLDVRAPIAVERIAADRDQLWAEAVVTEALGYSDVLPRDLWALASERQAAETTDDPWVDILRRFLELRASSDALNIELESIPADRVHTSELFEELGIAAANQTRGQAQRLRTVMEHGLRWTHRRSVRVSGRAAKGYVRN